MDTTNTTHMSPKQEEGINLREQLDKYLAYKWWMVVSVIIFLILGYLYVRYSMPVYESKASILVEQDKPISSSPEVGMLKDLGIVNGGGVLEDEMERFKSRTLMERVVMDLDLVWSYDNVGTKTGITRTEFYGDNPIQVRYLKNDSLLRDEKLDLVLEIISGQEYQIGDGRAEGKHTFGSVIQTRIGKLIISKTDYFESATVGKVIRIRLSPFRNVVEDLQKQLSVQTANKDANIIVLGIKGNNIAKNNAILNRLIAAHQENAVLNKNEIVRNTTRFINERMKFIAAELSDVEKEGETFKTQHRLIDVTTDAASYIGKESDLEKQVVETSIELNLVDFMNEFLKEQKGYDQLLPANLGFKELSIIEMTTQYNELVLERNRVRETSGERNPAVARIESQLAGLRSSLETSLRNLKNTLNLQLKKLSSEEAMYQSKIASIPQFEREYRDIVRQQQIKETLYLFLLQKREENEISLAATVSNTQVIDSAYSSELPVSPKKKIVFLGALLFGLILPIGIVYVKDLLDNKVKVRHDLERVGLSVLGDLPYSKDANELLVLNKPNSSLAEAFRVLRSSLSFILPAGKEQGKVISVTSSVGGEGKTFTSINLAYMFAATGQKVILVGLDLRKPRLKEYLDLKQAKRRKGVSNLMVDPGLDVKDCIEHVTRSGHGIDILVSGDIPPNPSELLLSKRLDNLVSQLREEYDIIVLDNAPVGLVVDTLSVNRVVDMNLYVIRANVLDKRYLPRIVSLKNEEKLKSVFVVLNGVKYSGSGAYQYGYGYGEHMEKRSIWKRIIRKK